MNVCFSVVSEDEMTLTSLPEPKPVASTPDAELAALGDAR